MKTEITTEITVVANHRPETLERILRVVVNMQMKLNNNKIWLDFSVQSEREIHLLINQLSKVYDVIDVVAD